MVISRSPVPKRPSFRTSRSALGDHESAATGGAGSVPAGTFAGPYSSPVITTAAVLACVLLAGLAVFQVALAAGRPWGRFAWGGQHDLLPPGLRFGSAVSVVLYAAFAVVILQAAGLLAVLPEAVADVGIWVLTGYFALGILVNGISRSRPERVVMTPLVLVLAACCLVVAPA
jgi:hypothetical protein